MLLVGSSLFAATLNGIADSGIILGDANDDGSVNVNDITTIATYILNGKASPWNEKNADANADGIINVNDITATANIILSKPIEEKKTITVNGVSFTMIRVEGGTFQMGATPEQMGMDDEERPVHSVTLSSYYIAETEVTQALWEAVTSYKPTKDSYQWKAPYGVGAQYPAYYVSWNDCQDFIAKLNSLTGEKFRMPTEAEWEYAARGGNKSKGYRYSGSNTIGDVAWYKGNAFDMGKNNPNYGTHAVKTKQPNELGLYDMTGNLWEWCQDWYGTYSSNPQTNPTGPADGTNRIVRGGHWGAPEKNSGVAYRKYPSPNSRTRQDGLRLAM